MGASGGVGESVRTATKTLTFTGAAGAGQAASAITFFTVTGRVLIATLVAHCTTDLVSAGGGTLAVGVTGSTALFTAATLATTIDATEFWMDGTPTAAGMAVPAALKDIAIAADIIGTVAIGDITGGVLELVVEWLPLSAGSSVVAA